MEWDSGSRVLLYLFKLADVLGNDAIYYIAGKPKTVVDLSKRLRNSGVSFRRIVFDPYIGY
ncbi:MAG: hypothetical protein ABS873_05250 [Alkalibacterium sp.]